MKRLEDIDTRQINKKEARRRLKQYLNLTTILGINKTDFMIYLIFFIISIVAIALYFFKQNTFSNVTMSFGCSMLGAILLAYFLALNNERISIQSKAIQHNKLLISIYGLMYSICASNNPQISNVTSSILPFLKGRERHDEMVFEKLEVLITDYIDSYGYYIEKSFYDELVKLKSMVHEYQLNIARIHSSNIDDNSLADALYTFLIIGVPSWFENTITENFIINHFIN